MACRSRRPHADDTLALPRGARQALCRVQLFEPGLGIRCYSFLRRATNPDLLTSPELRSSIRALVRTAMRSSFTNDLRFRRGRRRKLRYLRSDRTQGDTR